MTVKRVAVCLAALAVFAAGGACAFTLDIDAMKARTAPASDTLEAAQICSAMSMAFAFGLSDSEEMTNRYVVLSRMWIGIAADKNGVSYDDYMNNTAMPDVQSLSALDADTLNFYDGYCQTASAEVIAAAHGS